MEARKEWVNKGMIAICGVKNETSKDAYQNLEINSSKTTP
jgi:hypothetical protein